VPEGPGGGIAWQLAGVGQEVLLSFSRNPKSVERLAAEVGLSVSVGSLAEAVGSARLVVMISVPCSTLPQALDHADRNLRALDSRYDQGSTAT
jgi:predicted dinucleotide-binding enzyme